MESNTTQHLLFSFLQHIAMDSLDPSELRWLKNTNEKCFIQYLPLIMSYIKTQGRSQYKYDLYKEFISLCAESSTILIRVMLLHKAQNICLCKTHDFKLYSKSKQRMFSCGIVNDVVQKLDAVERITILSQQLEDILSWIDSNYTATTTNRNIVHFVTSQPNDFVSETNSSTDFTSTPINSPNVNKQSAMMESNKHLLYWDHPVDPFFFKGSLLSLEITKKYHTTSAPIEICMNTIYQNTQNATRFLYKKGDDLRIDVSAEISFEIFNVIWREFVFKSSPHSLDNNPTLPCAQTYTVIPLQNGGLIEVIGNNDNTILCSEHELSSVVDGRTYELSSNNNCESCANALHFSHWTTTEIGSLISTLSGGFVGGFVLGLRDRHLENMLFDITSHIFVHIDFGYILNRKPRFDANRFAVPATIRRELMSTTIVVDDQSMNAWDVLISLATTGYLTLRRNVGMITKIVTMLFLFDEQFSADAVNQCLMKSFVLAESESSAANALIGHLQVFSIQKMIKDTQHEILRWIRGNN
ncbi:PI3K/PI4K catalytic domain-containing protein [Entamoeba marina]